MCCSKVAKGRGFTFPIIFHDDWQSLCLFIDLWLFLSTYISQSVVITLSRFWANTFTLFNTQIPSMENMFTIVSWQFDSISISDFEYYQNLSVCVSSFFFVRFITSLV